MAKNKYTGYILDPQNLEELVHNAQFQLDNVQGHIGVKSYESALIKAECLVSALKAVVAEYLKS